MNHLIARTKGRNGTHFKVISNREVYQLPDDLNNTREYDNDYKLDDDEWFSINQFSEKNYCIDFLIRRFISTDYNQLPRKKYSNIDYLVAYQTGYYFFQKLNSSQIINRSYFSMSDQPELITNAPIILINKLPDAIYDKENDTLYFKKLTSISTIFNGIYELYKEATQEETIEFLESDFINLEDDFTAENVKKANRKRIAMAKETISKFTQAEKQDIFRYIREYCEELIFDENDSSFSVSNEEDLKKLLYGIEQRYYTTRIGGEKRLANSVSTV